MAAASLLIALAFMSAIAGPFSKSVGFLFENLSNDSARARIQAVAFAVFIVGSLLLSLLQAGGSWAWRFLVLTVLVYAGSRPIGDSFLLLPIAAFLLIVRLPNSTKRAFAKTLGHLAIATTILSVVVSPWRDWFYTPGYGFRLIGVFESPNTLYPIGLIAVSVLVDKSYRGVLSTVLVLVCIGAIVLTGSRSGSFALIGILCFDLIRRKRLDLKFIIGTGAGLAEIIGRFFFHSHAGEFDRSAASRVVLWKYAVREFADSPLLGLGPRAFAVGKYRSEMLEIHNRMPGDPKSIFLYYPLCFGIVGLVWLIFSVKMLRLDGAILKIRSLQIYLLIAMVLAGLSDTVFGLDRLLQPGTTLIAALLACTIRRDARPWVGSINLLPSN